MERSACASFYHSVSQFLLPYAAGNLKTADSEIFSEFSILQKTSAKIAVWWKMYEVRRVGMHCSSDIRDLACDRHFPGRARPSRFLLTMIINGSRF